MSDTRSALRPVRIGLIWLCVGVAFRLGRARVCVLSVGRAIDVPAERGAEAGEVSPAPLFLRRGGRAVKDEASGMLTLACWWSGDGVRWRVSAWWAGAGFGSGTRARGREWNGVGDWANR